VGYGICRIPLFLLPTHCLSLLYQDNRSMRVSFICSLLLVICSAVYGQTYNDSMAEFRKNYIADLMVDKGGPLKKAQAKNISFFPVDKNYRVWADFQATPGAVPFMLPTHSGKSKPYKEYGRLTFHLQDSLIVLRVYQSMNMLSDPQYKNYLFLPFRDMTNYDLTYGGGRYIDLKLEDIQNNRALIDFNKAYNPYCAYADGFSCPLPPDENRLHIEVRAGERSFIQ